MQDRIQALDALRGIAILMMILSGVVPYTGLPAWMYHAQLPPPDRAFDPALPGLTWVDLVFPIFIFTLGAAIPLAGKKFNSNTQLFFRNLLERTALLASFAILLQHFRPHQIMASPDTNAWLLALIGFVLLFGIYGKLPKNQPPWLIWLIKLLSATGAAVFVFNVSFQEEDFSLYRSDIILLILTNVYFFTAILWWLTRSKPAWRWLVLLILVGFSLSKDDIEFLTKIYGFSPLPWLYQFEYLEYLLLALPGVMVGEWLQRLNPETSKSETRNQWFLATHLLLICCMTLVGLQSRWIWLSFGASSILLFVVFRFRRQSHFYQLLLYGILFWVLGYLAEPLDGGIKKDPATLSYFLVTAGLSIFLLLVLVSMEKWWKSSRFYQLLVANGKNPMIAYVAFANFIWPILAITGLEKWINHWTDDPWTGMIKALAYTVLLALLIGFFTKKKLFWKT